MAAIHSPAVKKAEMKVKSQTKNAVVKYPFWFGGSASCFAAMCTHPLDLVKVRLQTRGPSAPNTTLETFANILRNHGPVGLYSGLSASLLRQMTYSTTRFGIYEFLKSGVPASQRQSLPTLIAMSSVSGFLGGMVGNPADVLNVRMQHDAALPPAERRNYKNAIDGMLRMTREEGWKSLFRGVWPNSMRAVLMTVSQLASYDTAKSSLMTYFPKSFGDNIYTHFIASLMAGFLATTVCSPVDVIKTRIMSASDKGSLSKLLSDVYRVDGVGWMFRGWVPSFVRLGPHTIATFMFLEYHKDLYRKYRGLED